MLYKMHQKTPTRIIATIPCFNNERSIAHVVKNTKEYADAVIVIDDGSEDKTSETASAAGAKGNQTWFQSGLWRGD